MELSDIRDLVRARYGLGATDPLFTNAVLTDLVNSSLRFISSEHDWPWLEVEATANTTAGVTTLTVDTHRKMQWMRYDGRELRYVNQRDRSKWFNQSGSPRQWARYAGAYHLLPTPDAVYTISYGYLRSSDATLSADTDEPYLPDQNIDLLVARVCTQVAQRKGDSRQNSTFYAEYANYLETMRDDTVPAYGGVLPTHTDPRMTP